MIRMRLRVGLWLATSLGGDHFQLDSIMRGKALIPFRVGVVACNHHDCSLICQPECLSASCILRLGFDLLLDLHSYGLFVTFSDLTNEFRGFTAFV